MKYSIHIFIALVFLASGTIANAFTLTDSAQCVGGTVVNSFTDVEDGSATTIYDNAKTIAEGGCSLSTSPWSGSGQCCSVHVSSNSQPSGNTGSLIPYTMFEYEIYNGGTVQTGFPPYQPSPSVLVPYPVRGKYFAGIRGECLEGIQIREPGMEVNDTDILVPCGSDAVAVTAALVASPTAIVRGEQSLLSWASTGATSCTGTNFLTSGATSGSLMVSPTATTQYTVTCTNGTTSANSSVTVAVATGTTLSVSCQPSPATGVIGQTVTWNSTVSGGSGSYTYSWTGTDGLSGIIASIQKVYSTTGIKTASLTVTSGGSSTGSGSGGGSCSPQGVEYNPTCNKLQEPATYTCPSGYKAQITQVYSGICEKLPQSGSNPYYEQVSCVQCTGGSTCTIVRNDDKWYTGNIGGGFSERASVPISCTALGAGYSHWNRSITNYCAGGGLPCEVDPIETTCDGVNNPTGLVAKPESRPSGGRPTEYDSGNVCSGSQTSQTTQSISTVCNGRICTSPYCDGNGAGGAGDTGGSGGVTITAAGECTAGNFCRGADVYKRNQQCKEKFVTACPVSCVNGACVSASTPEISLIATPPLIKRGGTCTLQVSAQNVQQCTLSGVGVQRVFTATGGIISTSQVITPPLVLTTPYTLSCINLSGGTVTKKVDCKIAPKFEEF